MTFVLALVLLVIALMAAIPLRRAIRVSKWHKLARQSSVALSHSLVAIMREASQVAQPGVSTLEINEFLVACAKRAGFIPYFLGYRGYPSESTTSVNDEVINTLPSNRILAPGDILKLQFGLSDGIGFVCQAWTYPVGGISPQRRALLTNTHGALLAGIRGVRAGVKAGDVAVAIAENLERNGLHGSRDFVGYRMGFAPHEKPRIPCNAAGPDWHMTLKDGMVLQLVALGHAGDPTVYIDSDTWNVKTDDRTDSALFSHMLLVERSRATVLTSGIDPGA